MGAVIVLRRHALMEALGDSKPEARCSLVDGRPGGVAADTALADVLNGRPALMAALHAGRRAGDRLAYSRSR